MEKMLWHTLEGERTLDQVQSGAQGLTQAQAADRLANNGPNKLSEGKKRTLFSIFAGQFADLMIWVLIGAAVLSGLLGEWVDAAIIMVVVVLNAILGTIQESRAEAALDALKQMAAPMARVRRGGNVARIAASELVVGDIVLLEAGDSVPADVRLLESYSLKVEESALTGESVPVDKAVAAIADAGAPLGDRLNMAHMGTSVTYGRGTGVVVATGMDTQMGAIAEQLAQTETETTPLQKVLNRISNVISIGVLAIAVVVFLVGLLGGNEPLEMFLTAVSLAVAAIPEGMVAVVTIVLAMGMRRMAGHGAIIRRLPAVETLGSTQVICSDKTGTLTQNRMTVTARWAQDEKLLSDAMGHCNDAVLDEAGKAVGDPTETALLDWVLKDGTWTDQGIRTRTRAGEIPFDSDRKRSTVAISLLQQGMVRIFVKGAPDVLVARCTQEVAPNGVVALDAARVQGIEKQNASMADQALRVLAFAYRDVPAGMAVDYNDVEAVEQGLTFIGLVGMIDPARPEAKEAIRVCRKAGILPVMITGDHPATATAIAKELGILTDGKRVVTGRDLEAMTDQQLMDQVNEIAVYARVAPEHKSRIVTAWQRRGKVVAMTGDGVNDAPALKNADIGVGMGITGTDVSKGASDMVLTDDNFATIVIAVREGRRIFENIHKTVRFLLTSNMGEVIAIFAATLAGWKLLLPIHILWINLVTDTFPALALGVEPAEPDIMDRKPRDGKVPFFNGRVWFSIALVGAIQAGLAIAAFLLGGQGQTGMTMAFLTLSLAQLFAAVGLQSERNSIFRIKVKDHPMLWLGFIGSALLQLVVILVAPLRNLFQLTLLTGTQWLIVLGLCVAMLLVIEVQKMIARMLDKSN